MPAPTLLIRDSVDADLPAIKAIYAHHVLHGTASFELDPPSIEEMRQRRAAVLAQGMFYLVAEIDGEVVGYAYATPYRPRPAYRHTVEDSVYVKTGRGGLGIGGKLLAALVERCARRLAPDAGRGGRQPQRGLAGAARQPGLPSRGHAAVGRTQAWRMARHGADAARAG